MPRVQPDYTLDGSEPTAASPVYARPMFISSNATIKARCIDDDKVGPAGTAVFKVNDTTSPRIISVFAATVAPEVRIFFSEPVQKVSAEDPRNYVFDPAMKIESASLSADGTAVTLKLADQWSQGNAVHLRAKGIADASPVANILVQQIIAVTLVAPVAAIKSAICPEQAQDIELPNLGQQWTINLFVNISQQPDNRTLIAGFGSTEKNEEGRGRYLAKFANGVHFWSRKHEVDTSTPLSLNRWQMLTAAYDGRTLALYKNGEKIADSAVKLPEDEAVFRIAPADPRDKKRQFHGEIHDATFWNEALSPEKIQLLWDAGKEQH